MGLCEIRPNPAPPCSTLDCVHPRHGRQISVPRPIVQDGEPTLRHGRGQRQHPVAFRMPHDKSAGVEKKGVDPGMAGHKPVVLLVPVPRVAHDGVPQVPKVEPNLVESARGGTAFHQAVPRGFVGANRMGEFDAGEGAVVGLGLLRQRVVCGRQGLLHHTFVLGPSSNHSIVGLGGAPVHKLQLQGIQGIPGRREQHDATRRLVQSMNGLQPSIAFSGFVQEVPQVVRLVKIDVRAMHEQTVGFDQCTDVRIFMQHPEGGRCIRRLGLSEVWAG